MCVCKNYQKSGYPECPIFIRMRKVTKFISSDVFITFHFTEAGLFWKTAMLFSKFNSKGWLPYSLYLLFFEQFNTMKTSVCVTQTR